MKPTRTLPAVLVLMIFIASCTTQKESATATDSTNTTDPATTEATSSMGQKVPLKGIYLTSTRVPAGEFGYKSMFDNNPNTYWATMPGAGPDEGVMLYFREPQLISQIEITQPQSEGIEPIESFSVYVNGSASGDYKLTDNKIAINANDVQSLFIRVENAANVSQQDRDGVVVKSFPAQSAVAISEIKLFYQDREIPVQLPSVVTGTMKASSTLEPAISYGVRNLFDCRKEFVWVEGAKGAGENESVTFQFNTDQEITGLKVMNGFQRSDKHFSANGRAKTLVVSNDKNESREVSLTDKQDEQSVTFDALSGKEFTIKVRDIYPGTQYKDLVLSELKFTNKNGDFIIADNVTEKIKQDLLAKAKGTMLERVLDQRIANEYQEMDGYKRSIILRSDYTFVAYAEDWTELSSGSETNEIIADGNWEIKELGADQVKIRIFGKLIRLSESNDYYNGNSSDSYLQIFQDNLLINGQTITGEKFIQELKMPLNDEG